MHNGTVSVLVRHLESYTLTNGIQKTKEHLEGDVYPFEIFIETIRNSPPDVFLRKVVLKICSKVSLCWFALQRQTNTIRRQKYGLFYLKPNAEFNELSTIF